MCAQSSMYVTMWKTKAKNKKQILDHIPRQSGSVSTWHFKSLSWELSSSRKGFSRGKLLGEQTINIFCSQIIIQTIFSIIRKSVFPHWGLFSPSTPNCPCATQSGCSVLRGRVCLPEKKHLILVGLPGQQRVFSVGDGEQNHLEHLQHRTLCQGEPSPELNRWASVHWALSQPRML